MTLKAIAGLMLAATLAGPLSLSAQFEIAGRAASVTVGGRLNTQYATSSMDDAVADFFVRRARLEVDMAIGEIVRGRVMPDFAGGETALQDAYLQLAFAPEFRISFGQFKRAFSVFELSSSSDLPLIERDGRIPGLGHCEGVGSVCTFSRLTQELGFDGRDVGVRAEGSVGERVSWVASLANGEGINVDDANDAKSFSGRVVFRPVEGAGVGLFGALHDYLDGDDETRRAGSVGADVEWGAFRDGLHLLAALVAGTNWQSGEDVGFRTVQALASYYHETGSERVAGVEPLLRLSWGDPDDDGREDTGLLVTPGLLVYIAGKNALGANLDWYSPAGALDSEWSLKLQTFLYF